MGIYIQNMSIIRRVNSWVGCGLFVGVYCQEHARFGLFIANGF